MTPRTYDIGHRERRGLIAGWRTGQVVTIGCGCLASMLIASLTSPSVGIGSALIILGLSIGIATLPIHGRSAEQWLPVLVHFGSRHRSRSFVELQIRELEHAEFGLIGILEEQLGYSNIVLLVDASCIQFLDPERRDSRVEGFSAMLGALGREGSAIDRVSWTIWSEEADPSEVKRAYRVEGSAGSEIPKAIYGEVLEEVHAGAVGYRIAITIRLRKSTRKDRSTDDQLIDAGITVVRALETSGHRRVEFASERELLSLFESGFKIHGTSEKHPNQLALLGTEHWSFAAFEGNQTCAWWIAEWPRHEVSAELLGQFFLGDGARCVAITTELVPSSVALRRAQHAKTTGAADDELRRRGGFLSDRRRERESDHLARRESELVDGFLSIRMIGFVSVRGHDQAERELLEHQTELAAAQAGIVLQRLNGDHGRGYVAALPLGTGLP
jgi:hypothetical protein